MMQHHVEVSERDRTSDDIPLHLGYLWLISFIAALGGLLFGYDWVVIGGARPFLESYFHLQSAALIGWVNSCALVGCFLGSLSAGRVSDRLGRKPVLIIAAVLFAVSSVLTGWAYSLVAFIVWRIVGGIAIGIASSISPVYIAEVSPAHLRGRLVSLNQLALVFGILAAQTVNWQIARPIPSGATVTALATSWNAQFGWRWMFTAVAVPAILFLVTTPFLPESPRWLMGKDREAEADRVLSRIGGERYSLNERTVIRKSSTAVRSDRSWRSLLAPDVRKMLLLGLGLVVLQQGSGINILFNYAEEVYRDAGFGMSDVLFNIVITGVINLVFTFVAMAVVDRFGRRQITILGCIGIGLSHLGASLAYHYHANGKFILVLSLCAIACYAMSLAPMTWVLLSEIFPTKVRAQAMSVSVAALWVASFALTVSFPFVNRTLGTSGTFLIYAGICLAGAVMVLLAVPDTKGRSLEDISR